MPLGWMCRLGRRIFKLVCRQGWRCRMPLGWRCRLAYRHFTLRSNVELILLKLAPGLRQLIYDNRKILMCPSKPT